MGSDDTASSCCSVERGDYVSGDHHVVQDSVNKPVGTIYESGGAKVGHGSGGMIRPRAE